MLELLQGDFSKAICISSSFICMIHFGRQLVSCRDLMVGISVNFLHCLSIIGKLRDKDKMTKCYVLDKFFMGKLLY